MRVNQVMNFALARPANKNSSNKSVNPVQTPSVSVQNDMGFGMTLSNRIKIIMDAGNALDSAVIGELIKCGLKVPLQKILVEEKDGILQILKLKKTGEVLGSIKYNSYGGHEIKIKDPQSDKFTVFTSEDIRRKCVVKNPERNLDKREIGMLVNCVGNKIPLNSISVEQQQGSSLKILKSKDTGAILGSIEVKSGSNGEVKIKNPQSKTLGETVTVFKLGEQGRITSIGKYRERSPRKDENPQVIYIGETLKEAAFLNGGIVTQARCRNRRGDLVETNRLDDLVSKAYFEGPDKNVFIKQFYRIGENGKLEQLKPPYPRDFFFT